MNCNECRRAIHPRSSDAAREDAHDGRGLCSSCYKRADYHGQLIDHPRRTRTRDEVLEEWDWLRRAGVPWQHAHERLGMTAGAFQRAYYRARAAGDPRAVVGVRTTSMAGAA